MNKDGNVWVIKRSTVQRVQHLSNTLLGTIKFNSHSPSEIENIIFGSLFGKWGKDGWGSNNSGTVQYSLNTEQSALQQSVSLCGLRPNVVLRVYRQDQHQQHNRQHLSVVIGWSQWIYLPIKLCLAVVLLRQLYVYWEREREMND